jgi:lysophospholipase L1-like esterase
LLLAEIITRIVWLPPSVQSTQQKTSHPIYNWAPIPGISGRNVYKEFDHGFSHSTQGLRGHQVYTAKKPDQVKQRILFLGDSFTYGQGVEDNETFVSLLNQSKTGIETINTGVAGYGQREELAVLMTLGRKLRPDLTIVMLFWNDLEDNLSRSKPDFALTESNELVRTDISLPADFDPLAKNQGKAESRKEDNIFRRTYLYKLFKEGAEGFRHRLFGNKPRKIQTQEQIDSAWEITERLLSFIKHETQSIGSDLVIVSIPDYGLVDPQETIDAYTALNTNIEQRLTEICQELDIPYLDLLPGLKQRQSVSKQPLYYRHDRHTTAEGHRQIAEIIRLKVLADRD